MVGRAGTMRGPEGEQAGLAVLRSGRLAQGRRVAEFEEAFAEYLGAKHAIAVSSGTSALIIALTAHGISDGDEVLVPTFTYAATANAVLLVGARPVLIDIRADTFTIDVDLAEAAITPQTRAIVPVHLFGHPADLTGIRALAGRHGLIVVEDACQSLGATWQGRQIGASGTACFSFYATKAVATGEGGMIVTDDGNVAARARKLRNQGEGERYVTELLSANHRMTEIAAAISLSQLARLDDGNDKRRTNAAWLSERLAGVTTPSELPDAHHVYQQYTIRADAGRRDGLQSALADSDIEAVIYYARSLHQQPLYQKRGIGGSFPVAEAASREVLSLPVHPGLSAPGLERIAATVNSVTSLTESRSG